MDDLGYPIHGHLTWADTRWWVHRFEAAGFQREDAVEQALHLKYDAYMEKRAPARRAFFVFSKNGSPARRAAIVDRIARDESIVSARPGGSRGRSAAAPVPSRAE